MLNIGDLKENYLNCLFKLDLSKDDTEISIELKKNGIPTCGASMFNFDTKSRAYVNGKCWSNSCRQCRNYIIDFVQKNYTFKANNISNWR